jgi:hypothetical protein
MLPRSSRAGPEKALWVDNAGSTYIAIGYPTTRRRSKWVSW